MVWFTVMPNDIVKRFRPLNPTEVANVAAMIEDAQDILEDAAEGAGISVPTTDRGERAYKRVVAAIVIRVLKNPNGYLTESIDDYTYRRDSAISAGVLYASPEEVEALRANRRPRRGAFTIVPS